MEQVQTKKINGIGDVFAPYDGFILDLWGVLHDGLAPFPGTIPTLELLKKAKRKVWLLSNAPRRAHLVAGMLENMGIGPDLYTGLLTSGEASWHALREELIQQWGRRCLYIGLGDRDNSVFEGLDLDVIRDPEKADFILCASVEDAFDTVDQYGPLLAACAERKLPMLCANPDKVVHVGNELVVCAGTLAGTYREMGGEVVFQGKPHRAVYARCLQAMGTRNVLAVGDSMLTDIAGAIGAGLDSVLVASGLHREEFKTGDLSTFLANYPYRPHYVTERFTW